MNTRHSLYDRLATDFMGLARRDPVLTQALGLAEKRRVYLDTTATSLMPRMVIQSLHDYFEDACANNHTEAHRAGRDTTAAIEESRIAVGNLVGYDPARDVVLFTANGATGATNFLARALFPPELRIALKRFPKGAPQELRSALAASTPDAAQTLEEMEARPIIVTTVMEHHSNLLPWVEAVGHHNIRAIQVHPKDGTLDMEHLARVLAEEGARVRLVAVTGVSNVTGIINPVHQIARMAHAVGAQILVDAAQWVPHAPVRMHTGEPGCDLDYLVLSGHKVYAPGSRGALVGSSAIFDCRRCVSDVGGGMVEYVALDDFDVKQQITAREEAGTPNIPGTIAMGLIAKLLLRVGMDVVAEAEERLTRLLVDRLARIDGVRVYGSTDLDRVPRAGVVSFNVVGWEHARVAAYLNDFHNIAVRNGCFCAHPYAKALMAFDREEERCFREQMSRGDRRNIPGMVRASLGLYSTADDVEALGAAVEELIREGAHIMERYEVQFDGAYRLPGAPELPTTFSIDERVTSWAATTGLGAMRLASR